MHTNIGFAEMVDESVRIQAGIAHTLGTTSCSSQLSTQDTITETVLISPTGSMLNN